MKGILFSPPMVRAILGGTKTQTRRLIVKQPPADATSAGRFGHFDHPTAKGWCDDWEWLGGDTADFDTLILRGEFKTGYLESESVYVRESWRAESRYDSVKASAIPGNANIWFGDQVLTPGVGRLRPGIFLPAALARIVIEITAVKVERLQEIDECQAKAEGVASVADYAVLWDALNKARAPWATNPWVTALSFRVIE